MTTGKIEVDNINILVIDDCSTSSTLIRHQLVALGAKVSNITCVNSAQESLLAVKTRFYSFIVMDYHLSTKLTGLDLINLMSRAKLISDTTAVLMISGDATQETVLTALSGRVRHLLTKPLQTKALKNKMLTALQEQHQLAEVRHQLNKTDKLTLAGVARLHKNYAQSVCVESLLIDTLIESKQFDVLENFLPFCAEKEHASRICAEAFVQHKQGNIREAVTILADYVTRNPLCLRAIDNLVGLYENLGQQNNASILAIRAFELTPSSSTRLVTVSRILSKLGQVDRLYDVGYMYASNVSSTDPHWLSAMNAYVDTISEHFKTMSSTNDKKRVLLKLNEFCLLAEKQLNRSQQVDLAALKQMMQCKLLLLESRPEHAHKKLMQSLSYYYSVPSQTPLLLLKQAIPLMDFFGEFAIKRSLLTLVAAKSAVPLKEQSHHNMSELELRKKYPFSTEIRLRNLSDSNISAPDTILDESIEFLTQRPLPPNWSNWLKDYLSGSCSTRLPVPFNLHMPQWR
ncbi:response regulator [Vibrio hyugaensis]|uniref:Response regulator n=1 Tax=Vibrio hyugaensis TaxID=1534743 RepID=A0ABQ5Y218_9VIBR|nr:response regulator [Vibrio hyugaensis]GLR04966.1 response regulator [Vibrio hyugaensis]